MNKERQFYIIYQLRKQFPTLPLFYYLNLFLKAIGLYISTHNIRNLENNNYTLFKILTFFLLYKANTPRISNHEGILLAIFITLVVLAILFPILVSIMFHYQTKGKMNKQLNVINSCNIPNLSFNSNKKSVKLTKILLCIITYLLLLIIFLIQHLIEFLLTSLVIAYLPSSMLEIKQVQYPSLITYTTVKIINTVSLLLLCIYYYTVMLFSFRSLEEVGISYRNYKINYAFYITLLSVFLQGIHSISHLLPLTIKLRMLLGVNIISVLLLFLDIWINWIQFSLQIGQSYYITAIYCIKWECLYSGIIEIIIYYSMPNDKLLTSQMSLYKQITLIILVIATFYLTHHYYTLRKAKSLSTNLFLQSEPKTSLDELKLFSNMITDYFNGGNDQGAFKALLTICQEHISHCGNAKCLCRRISSYNRDDAGKTNQMKIEKLIKELIIIGEQEINSHIVNFLQTKANNHSDLSEMIFFHINYIGMIKHDKVFAFYLVHNYYHNQLSRKHGPYLTKYYLYEAKRYMYYEFINEDNGNGNGGGIVQLGHKRRQSKQQAYQRLNIPSSPSSSSSNEFYSIIPIYKYLLAIDSLIKTLLHCCHNLEMILLYITSALLGKNTSASSNELLNLLQLNQTLHHKLYTTFIKGIYSKEYKSLVLNYLLLHYFLLINGKTPSEYTKLFEPRLCYNDIDKESSFFDSYPKENNSVIASLNYDDSFTLTYVSHVFCDKFHWSYDGLINGDFNKLLPNEFGVYHNRYLKFFALSNMQCFVKSNTFLLNESSLLIPVSIEARKLLLLNNGFNLLFVFTKRKIYTSTTMNYPLLLGKGLGILSVSNTFEKHFYFTKEMFTKLKINFCDFTGLNCKRLQENFNQIRGGANAHCLDEINKTITIFNTIATDKTFSYRGFNALQSFLNGNQTKTYSVIVPKVEIFNNTSKILQYARNFNLENSIIERIGALKDRISQTFVDRAGDRIDKEYYKIEFELKVLGRLVYFIVCIEENISRERIMKLSIYSPSFKVDDNTNCGNGDGNGNGKQYEDLNSLIILNKEGIMTTGTNGNGSIRKLGGGLGGETPIGMGDQSRSKRINWNQYDMNSLSNKANDKDKDKDKDKDRDKVSILSSIRAPDSMHITSSEHGASNTNIRFLSTAQFNKSGAHSSFYTNANNTNANINSTNANMTNITNITNNSHINLRSQAASKYDKLKSHHQPKRRHILPLNSSLILRFIDSSLARLLIHITILLILSLFLGNTIYFLLSLDTSVKIFKINYESFILKADAAFCSLLFIRNCLIKEDINSIEALDFTWKFQLRSQTMLNNLNLLLLYINELNSFSHMASVYAVLYTHLEYKILQDDWTETKRLTSITDELNTIFYFFSTVYHSNDFQSCNVKAFNTNGFMNSTRPPNTEEKFLYYIIHNSMTSLLNQIDLLSNHTLEVYKWYQDQTRLNYFIVSVISIVISSVLFALLLTKAICGNKIIKQYFLELYDYDIGGGGRGSDNTSSDALKARLNLFKTVLVSFNKHTAKSYEAKVNSIKQEASMGFNMINKGKIMTNMSYSNSLNLSATNATDTMKKRAEHDKANEEKAQLLRMSFENLKHFSRMIQLPIVNTIISTLIIIFTIDMCFTIAMLLYLDLRISGLQTQNDIGINLLERIPIFAQLLLYYTSSIIQNDAYYITKKNSDYVKQSFNYYNITIDFKANSIYLQLTTSNYAYLYFKLQLAQKTTERYLTDTSKHHMLLETLDWYHKFDSKTDFPIHTAIGFVKYYQSCDTVLQCMEAVNTYSMANLYVANEMAANSMDSVFDLMTQELNYLYLNFDKEDKGNANGKRDKLFYLSTENFWIIFENSQRAIKAASDIFNVSVLNDVVGTYKEIRDVVLIIFFFTIGFKGVCMYSAMYMIFEVIGKKKRVLRIVEERIIKAKRLNSGLMK